MGVLYGDIGFLSSPLNYFCSVESDIKQGPHTPTPSLVPRPPTMKFGPVPVVVVVVVVSPQSEPVATTSQTMPSASSHPEPTFPIRLSIPTSLSFVVHHPL